MVLRGKEDAQRLINRLFPNQIEILKFTRKTDPITIKCKKCGAVRTYNAGFRALCFGFCCNHKDKIDKNFILRQCKILFGNRVIPKITKKCYTHRDKIKYKCVECNRVRETYLSYLLGGVDCPECSRKEQGFNCRKIKTIDDFYKYLPNKYITCTSTGKCKTYKSICANMYVKCKDCGYVIKVNGLHPQLTACANCANKYAWTGGYVESLHKKQPNLQIVAGTYKNVESIMTFECTKCGKKFVSSYSEARSHGCPKCNPKQTHQYTEEQFFAECAKVHNNKYEYIKGSYEGSHDNLKYRCKCCGNIITQNSYSHRSRGIGCPCCTIGTRASPISNTVISCIEKACGLSFVYAGKNKKEYRVGKYYLDGYNKYYNIGIEFNGDYFHGNPEVYQHNKDFTGTSFKHSYDATMRKQGVLKRKCNLIVVWERDWKKNKDFLIAQIVKHIYKIKTKGFKASLLESNVVCSQA